MRISSYLIEFVFGKDSLNSTRLKRARITSSAQIISRFVNLGVKFLSVPLAVSILGQELYGVWLVLLSIIAWFSVSDLGLPAALINPLAEAIGNSNSGKTRELISTTAFLLFGVGLSVALVCTVLALVLPMERVLGMSSTAPNFRVRLAIHTVVWLNLGMLVLRLTDVITAAMQQGYLGSLQNIVGSFLTLIGMIALKLSGGDIASLALVVILPTTLVRIALWGFLIYRYGNAFSPRWRFFSRETLNRVSRTGFVFFVGTWGELLVLQTPNIIISQVLGATSVPLFAVPYQIYYSAYVILNTLAAPLWPAYAEAKSNGDQGWIRSTHWRVMKESTVLAIVGFLILGAVAPWLVGIWAGSVFKPPAAIAWALSILFVQWSVNYVWVVLLTGLGFIWQRTGVVLVFGLLNVLISVWLTRWLGVNGTVLGLSAAMLITQTWYLPWILSRKARWVFSKASHAVLSRSN